MRPDRYISYQKVVRVIKSCKTEEQLTVAKNMVQMFINLFYKSDCTVEAGSLQAQLRIKYRMLLDATS